jgi:3-deoxy-manno-octulosonate cytidylyltransferase (CMP-KDO synthetase)
VEQHGENPLQNVVAIIPARYSSTRLPGKLLLDIAGKALILHTLERAKLADTVSKVIVATDDERIFDIVADAGGEVAMTSPDHRSGSDRIAEVAESLSPGTIIVNVQGDEPMISSLTIDKAVKALLSDSHADIATTSEPITDLDDIKNGNVVKVVTNSDGYALYFSRSPVPYPRQAMQSTNGSGNADLLKYFRKHSGLYVYRREYLLKFTRLPPSRLEQIEMLEQLRALEDGARIKVVEVDERSIGVDTQGDLERVRRLVEER